MFRPVIFLPLLAVCALASEQELETAALQSDDQCANAGSGECALNALQRKIKSHSAEEGEELLEEQWLKDISTSEKNKFKHELVPLQKPIVAEYQALSVLDVYANYTMKKRENATGMPVAWNKKGKGSLLQLLEEEDPDQISSLLEDEADEASSMSSGRRRGSASKSLPPRARYVNKILIYLEKEMQAVWNLHTLVDRKRWGCGNVITSNPYGAHGEHPDNWHANITVPKPTVTPSTAVPKKVAPVFASIPKLKAKAVKHSNKYAQQLQTDYESLIANIHDAYKKTEDLKQSLLKMDNLTDQFISEPYGEYHRIETQ